MNKNKIVSMKLVGALVVGAALLLGADAWAAEKQPVNVIFGGSGVVPWQG